MAGAIAALAVGNLMPFLTIVAVGWAFDVGDDAAIIAGAPGGSVAPKVQVPPHILQNPPALADAEATYYVFGFASDWLMPLVQSIVLLEIGAAAFLAGHVCARMTLSSRNMVPLAAVLPLALEMVALFAVLGPPANAIAPALLLPAIAMLGFKLRWRW